MNNAVGLLEVHHLKLAGIKDINIWIGDKVNKSKANEKARQFREFFPKIPVKVGRVSPSDFHDFLKSNLIKPLQIIFTMSGEWKAYHFMFQELVKIGLKNKRIWVMKYLRTGFGLAYWEC